MNITRVLAAVVFVSVAACRPREASAIAVPPGRGWFCAAPRTAESVCVRQRSECDALVSNAPGVTCKPLESAYCFTFEGKDGVHRASCKMTSAECERQSTAFSRDEAAVSSCAALE